MNKIIRNIKTGQEFIRPIPTNNEIEFFGGVMITETDVAGIVTYANKTFRDMTGYSLEEIIGSPHNINRHPDMPKVAFQEMWQTIKKKKYWQGYVKNLTKDGSYYLVEVWVKAKLDENEKIIGYIAGRKVANKENMQRALAQYKVLKEKEYRKL